MAVIRLRSTDGSDASDGSTWADAKATLAAALTAAGAGGTVYVSKDHAEAATGSITLASPGTAASPTRVICVDDTGDPEPPTATATTGSVTAGNTSGNMSVSGHAYVYGLTIGIGTSGHWVQETAGGFWILANCIQLVKGELRIDGSVRLQLSDGSKLRFGATSNYIRARGGEFVMRGGAVADTGSVPTVLVNPETSEGAILLMQGVDLSAFGSGKTICDVDGGANNGGHYQFIDCKLDSSVTLANTPAGRRVIVEFINSDGADTNYRFHRITYESVEQFETTIVRTGGASDGTTPVARKVITAANVTDHFNHRSMWLRRWNEDTGSSKTATVSIVSYGASKLTDAQVWLELEYLGTSGFPLGLFASDRVSDPIFGTPADQATDTGSTWQATARADLTTYSANDMISVQGRTWICTTGGLSNASEPAGYATAADGDSVNDGTAVFRAGWRQKIEVAVTPQEKGLIRGRMASAVASTTIYYDPKLVIT